jgi:hypothetical protein
MLLAAVSGCHAPEQRPDATLSVRIHQAQAAVYLDDALLPVPPGQSEGRTKLFSGLHRIEVRAPGCFTAYQEVFIPKGQAKAVDLVLRQDPDEETEPACAPLPGSGI